ncbi:MAG: orotidine-5'-phosphate decarboxylase [Gemmataceae bacterium]
MEHFADRLAAAVRVKNTSLCVGIDPRVESLPTSFRLTDDAKAVEDFCVRVLELIGPHVGVVKPQSAFFEMLGPQGLAVQQWVMERATAQGALTILDAKRGDIASTACAYADAAFDVWDADALTVNPYLGRDGVEPFIEKARKEGRGIFVLVRTSNPGAGMFQDLDCGGRKLYEVVADEVRKWSCENIGKCGYGDVGAVVGATHPAELKALRERMPEVWFLVPGYGAQGGTAADVRPAFRADGLGAIVNSSRGVTFPFKPDDQNWEEMIVAAAKKAAEELKM